jgi:GDP-L-fucose synthase
LTVKSKNLLILGANGFLGKNVTSLLNEKYDYKIFKLNGKNELDLTKDDLFNDYLSKNKIDYIINCAAFVGGIAYGYDFPAELLSKNTVMASNIYKAAYENGVKLLVNPISNCAYPKDQNLYEEKNFWDGAPHESVFEYGFSKKFFVALGNAYFREYNFSSANIVLSNMYGPHDHFDEKKSHALGALIKKIYDAKLNNFKNVEIWGTGKPIREWLYVTDGADALIKSTALKENSYFFNIGVNKGMSIKEMAVLIAKIIDWDGEFIFDTSKPDGAKEKRVLGKFTEKNFNWSPQISLENGIRSTVEWYKDNILKI